MFRIINTQSQRFEKFICRIFKADSMFGLISFIFLSSQTNLFIISYYDCFASARRRISANISSSLIAEICGAATFELSCFFSCSATALKILPIAADAMRRTVKRRPQRLK